MSISFSKIVSKWRWLSLRLVLRSYLTASGGLPPKVFCVGANKTGTTSIEQVFRGLGLKVAPQYRVEKYFYDVDFDLKCELFWRWIDKFEAFQDAPFSWSWVLPELIRRYPNACYVLTTRNVDQWYTSIKTHHFHELGLSVDASGADIMNAITRCTYISPGYFEKALARLHGPIGIDSLYSEDIWKKHYINHVSVARSLLKGKRFLEISLSEETDTSKICHLLGLPSFFARQMPHLNTSNERI